MNKQINFSPFFSLFKMIKSLPWRYIFPIFLCLSAIVYFIYGWKFSERLINRSTQGESARMVNEIKKGNPEHRAEIERLEMKYGAPALATKIKFDSEAIKESISIPLLSEHLENGTIPPELPLFQLVDKTYLRDDPSSLISFTEEFYAGLTVLEDYDTQQQILSLLNEASQNPRDWRVVSSSLIGPFVWQATKDSKNLWNYYSVNYQWLSDPLLFAINREILMLSDNQEFSLEFDYDISRRIVLLIELCQKYDNILCKLLKSDFKEQIALILPILELHGKTIQTSVNKYGLPLTETIEVLYANMDFYESSPFFTSIGSFQEKSEYIAYQLSIIYNEHHDVWGHAKSVPFALKFFYDSPSFANRVLEMYGNNPSFLLQLYDFYDERNEKNISCVMPYVAEALVKYEDLAAYILYEYRDNQSFKISLTNPEIGSRVIPFVARFPEKLSDLNSDPRWINKYFDAEGKVIDDERWWEAVPVGSLAKILKNKVNGVPCTWSEIGWAVYDTVDIALAVGTAGASKAVTSGLKGIAKLGVKSVRVMDKTSDTMRLLRKMEPSYSLSKSLRLKSGSKYALSLLSRTRKNTSSFFTKMNNTMGFMGSRIRNVDPRWWRKIAFGLAAYKLYARHDTLFKAPEQIGETIGHISHAAMQKTGNALANIVKELPLRYLVWVEGKTSGSLNSNLAPSK